ncbi:MAG TPA: efflux RND transporter periplasmic adaptor subunit [Candidatus Angelobacter sp.]|nr:efflux RND transporter periplasmic adaptor subunit [Candidatus Angelobacter sp.]
MNKAKKIWIALLIVTVAVVALAARMLTGRDSTQYFTEKVGRGDIRDVVEATGTINAVITVQVGSQVSGTIDKLYADFNSKVKKNQVIARIDPSLFEGALLQAKADLENARANASSARANLEKAKAAEAQARADYERTKPLTTQGVMSPQALDVSKANEDAAKSAISAAEAGVLQADAQVSQKAAAVTVAQTNLDHTIIRAPIDGVVVSRNIDIGQTVAASLQAPTLFTIAQDLTKMQVYTKTDESDVGHIKTGQPVTFKVDAFPSDEFRGKVAQIRMNATTVQNVVTYDTIIEFDNPDMKLFPGMTAYVTIPVASAHDVLKIPNSALRYKPDLKPEELRQLYAQAGIAAPGMKEQGSQQGAEQQRPSGQAGGAGRENSAQAQQQRREVRPTDVAVIWKMLPTKKLEPVQVRTGITDHATTALVQVLKGEINEGDPLITGATKGQSNRNAPGFGGPPRGR